MTSAREFKPSSPAQKMPRQLYDLQNLPEDPVLGATRARDALLAARSTMGNKADSRSPVQETSKPLPKEPQPTPPTLKQPPPPRRKIEDVPIEGQKASIK